MPNMSCPECSWSGPEDESDCDDDGVYGIVLRCPCCDSILNSPIEDDEGDNGARPR